MSTYPCPDCKGAGKSGPVHINRGDKPHEWRESMDCQFCQGSGHIDQDHKDSRDLGEKLRAKRAEREETLMAASIRLGLKPSELSGLERGRGGMTAWHHPWATRLKLEVIFPVSDFAAEQRTLADALELLLRGFRAPDTSANHKPPHYDSLEISVERKAWDAIEKDR